MKYKQKLLGLLFVSLISITLGGVTPIYASEVTGTLSTDPNSTPNSSSNTTKSNPAPVHSDSGNKTPIPTGNNTLTGSVVDSQSKEVPSSIGSSKTIWIYTIIALLIVILIIYALRRPSHRRI